MIKNKNLTEREKQFVVLSNEVDLKCAQSKAHQAVSKALSHVKKTKPLKSK